MKAIPASVLASLCLIVRPSSLESVRVFNPFEKASLIRQKIDSVARTSELSGVVLIAREGKPLLLQAYGFANRSDGVPNRDDTRFNLASMGKMFTAVAILQQVEAGRLALEAKVGKYLPDYPDKALRETVTIHQLLTHTSGMGNFWEEHGKAAKERFRAVSDFLPLFAGQPLLFPPGTSFAYSNSGYMVLGLVLEAVTGKSYFDVVREGIFRPSGMLDTDAYELDQAVPRLAIGYSRSRDEPGVWRNNLYVNVVKGGPAGGSYSTAGDLLRFAEALTSHRLLSPEGTRLLTTGKVPYRSGKYAYGFIEETVHGHRIFGHSGGHIGIAGELMILPDLGLTVVILTNGDVESFWEARSAIRRLFLGVTPEGERYAFTRRLVEAVVAKGFEEGERILKTKPAEVDLHAGLIEEAGHRLLWEGKKGEALSLFRLGVAALPNLTEASAIHLGLADARARMGEKGAAIEGYERYLAVEPGDEEVRAKLRRLTAPAPPGRRPE